MPVSDRPEGSIASELALGTVVSEDSLTWTPVTVFALMLRPLIMAAALAVPPRATTSAVQATTIAADGRWENTLFMDMQLLEDGDERRGRPRRDPVLTPLAITRGDRVELPQRVEPPRLNQRPRAENFGESRSTRPVTRLRPLRRETK